MKRGECMARSEGRKQATARTGGKRAAATWARGAPGGVSDSWPWSTGASPRTAAARAAASS